jgi:hypothetical protein
MTEDFVISYPASLKKIYDPITAQMAKSLIQMAARRQGNRIESWEWIGPSGAVQQG